MSPENYLSSRVSVVIPTFNRAQILKRALASVINQTYKNLEVIVVDDGSLDNSGAIIGSFDNRIRCFLHDKNKGPAAARNTGIKNAGGDFIAFLDSDDEWSPKKIERQLETFNQIKEKIGLIFTNGYSEQKGKSFISENIPSGIYYNPYKDRFYPLRKLIAPPSAWLLPTQVIREIGYFDETMYNWDDGDYLVRVSYKYPLYFLNENLVTWHVSKTHVNVITSNLINGKEIFLQKNLKFLKKDRQYLFRFYRTMGKDLLGIDKKKARRFLLNALRLRPLDFATISKIYKTFIV